MTLFVSAGSIESVQGSTAVGVGLLDVTLNLARIFEKQRADNVIFLGSAGAYSKETPLLSLHISNSASQIESSALKNESYSPLNLSESSFLESSLKYPLCKVNSSNYICKDAHSAQLFSQRGLELENMEFYSVLKVANHYKIPAMGIFCVSNYCDVNAHEDFKKNHPRVLQILNEALKIYKESHEI